MGKYKNKLNSMFLGVLMPRALGGHTDNERAGAPLLLRKAGRAGGKRRLWENLKTFS